LPIQEGGQAVALGETLRERLSAEKAQSRAR
jgi:hypothetical protein